VKGTRLWIEAGSPLIRGASRNARSFRREWFVGSLVASAVAGAAIVYRTMPTTAEDAVWLLPVLVGAGVACWPATWVARRMGSRRAWIAGAVGGTLGAGVAVWATIYFDLIG